MPSILSVNIGVPRPTDHSDVGVTAIDKRPATEPVRLRAPKAMGGTAFDGDTTCDERFHGGPDQAVYAYAREDLDRWAVELGRRLVSGCFGENLTTSGLDVTGAVLGERWRVGSAVLLEVSAPRIPCRTFAGWIGEDKWVKTFTAAARPGAYLRVLEEGTVQAGDAVEVVERPDHGVGVGLAFRALTTEPELRELLIGVDGLAQFVRDKIQGGSSQPS